MICNEENTNSWSLNLLVAASVDFFAEFCALDLGCVLLPRGFIKSGMGMGETKCREKNKIYECIIKFESNMYCTHFNSELPVSMYK